MKKQQLLKRFSAEVVQHLAVMQIPIPQPALPELAEVANTSGCRAAR